MYIIKLFEESWCGQGGRHTYRDFSKAFDMGVELRLDLKCEVNGSIPVCVYGDKSEESHDKGYIFEVKRFYLKGNFQHETSWSGAQFQQVSFHFQKQTISCENLCLYVWTAAHTIPLVLVPACTTHKEMVHCMIHATNPHFFMETQGCWNLSWKCWRKSTGQVAWRDDVMSWSCLQIDCNREGRKLESSWGQAKACTH